MDLALKKVPGWIIDRPTYSRMATWETKLVDAAIVAFNPDLRAQANYEPIKALVASFNKPTVFVSIRVFARTRGRPELDQQCITIWKHTRAMHILYETDRWFPKPS